jgi:hypothetical protein
MASSVTSTHNMPVKNEAMENALMTHFTTDGNPPTGVQEEYIQLVCRHKKFHRLHTEADWSNICRKAVTALVDSQFSVDDLQFVKLDELEIQVSETVTQAVANQVNVLIRGSVAFVINEHVKATRRDNSDPLKVVEKTEVKTLHHSHQNGKVRTVR